jgi:putative transport protein
MPAMMGWIKHALQDHPELALFLALSAGHWVGRLRIKSFKLGAVVGCLLTGVAMGQLDIAVPSVLGRTFFLLFLFSVGYKTGPQFFRGFGKSAIPQVILTLLFAGAGLLTTYAVAHVLGFDAGTATGLLAGGLHSSEAVGTGIDAISKLPIADNLRQTLTTSVAVAYAATYLIAMLLGIFILTRVGPWVMRIDLRAECQRLENELGIKKDEPGVISAYKQFVMRSYRIPADTDNKTVEEFEDSFSPERVFVERVRNESGIFDAESNLRLKAGNFIALSGRPGVLGGPGNPLQHCEVEEPALLDIPTIAVDHVFVRKDLLYKTFAEIVKTLEAEVATRGVYVRKVLRVGEELPLGSKLVIEPGDVLTLIGAKRHVERVAARLGSVERSSHATDIILLCLAIGIGGLIGVPALQLTRLSIGLGLPVGVLAASLVVGWLHSIRPFIARVPESVIWFLDSIGLSAFVATIGINAGPGFVQGVRSSGLVLLLSVIVVCAVPYLVTILVGYYVFRLHPGILLGIVAGSGTNSPGLAALQEEADSRVPILGYGLSYALGAVIFALWGSVIVALVHRT